MADVKNLTIYNFSAEQLIQTKELRLKELRTKQWELLTKEDEIRNAESNLLLKTDFKELKLTNEKMRTAYINDALHKQKFELTQLKHEVKQIEDSLAIVNDLLNLRLKEIGD